MKRLLFLMGTLLVLAPTVSAQWVFDGSFPSDESTITPHTHALAVDPDAKVWTLSYYPFAGDSVEVDIALKNTTGCSTATGNCRVTAIHVFNADGSPASFSPLNIVTLPGGEQDTLGGEVVHVTPDSTRWSWKEGTGLRAGPDGNVYAAIGKRIFKFDYETGEVLAFAAPEILLSATNSGMAVDDSGNIFITGTFPGDPIAIFNSNLEYVENVVDADGAFNRNLLALPDGNTVFALNYSAGIATVYQRADEFSAWDSTGVAFEGMKVESGTIHPVSGNIWVSAGSPLDPPSAPWKQHTWYEFTVEDALANAQPTPLDSITWNSPGDGRPRAIAFSPDGLTAYVGEFNQASPATQKFVYAGTSVVEGPSVEGVTLHQNAPNPFTASTTLRYDLEAPATVRLTVYDAIGRAVATLADGVQGVGTHTATFEGNGLAGGVYTYVLQVDGSALTGRMVLMR